ncbi:hypothetical protein L2Y96_14205 [Luteibacter aegosomaticola]|uniref:hypothetical protein n=1 Tax=Luteibacter aegosomaticola TaxID=2911538 RepID=UPI001FF838A5|nr:hypothetical protein [Luteibacter aegosomaticola]UPG88571.1 hypothetical protein L2Y96_14205 [Luteibacter aegosomaticola]
MDETRKAGARARYAAMDTDALERIWVGEERVDWAEAALREELVSRDIDPEALTARAAMRAQAAQPEWVSPADSLRLARPQGVQRAARYAIHSLCGVLLLAAGVIWWQRPARLSLADTTPSIMEGVAAAHSAVTADASRRTAVILVQASLARWWHDSQAIEKGSQEADTASPWEAQRYATALQRDAVASDLLRWRVEIAAHLTANETLVTELEHETLPLPPDVREQFMQTVVTPAHAYVEAEKKHLEIGRQQLALIENLGALAAKHSPSVDPKTGDAAFSGSAATEYADILKQRSALAAKFAEAGAASDSAYESLLHESRVTIGQLGE